MLCLTLTGHNIDEDYDILWRNRQYIDMAELRLDFLDNPTPSEIEKASEFPSKVDLPVILSCRRTSDGGFFRETERKRISLLKKVLNSNYSFIDIEFDVNKPDLDTYVKSLGVRIIRSIHDINGIPENLSLIINKIAEKGDIPKATVTPQSTKDVLNMFRFVPELSEIKEKIIVGMGSFGVCTRILYKKLGSMLCFCSEQNLLGMLNPRDMKELYQADRVNAQTKIYGVIGNPISHSVSPNIHNPGFHGIRFNAIYVPFLVDNVRMFFRLAELLQINGFSITIPHKQEVIPYLGKTTREVRQLGSCNTVVREHGLWKGSNTDYYGFISLLGDCFENGSIKNAVVIGAGGGARAVVFALRNNNVNVIILNRTQTKAAKLAHETMSQYDTLENAGLYSGKADLIVQATSVGMEPDYDSEPAPTLQFTGKEIVCDLIYKPYRTKFLRRANEAGCRIIYGLEFLEAQGKLQFEAYSGYHYPRDVKPAF